MAGPRASTFAAALMLLFFSGCMGKPPLKTGYVYTVALKPGTGGVGCYPAMGLLHKELILETRRTYWRDLDAFASQNGVLLHSGDKALLLATYALDGLELSSYGGRYDARGTEYSKLKLRVLRTGATCYAYNGGAGPGLGLFELCLPYQVFSEGPCPASAPYPFRKERH
jgi:hypothetical protein